MASIHIAERNALFLHLPKTAGWSVTSALGDAFPTAVRYPCRGVGEGGAAASFLASRVGRTMIERSYSFCFVRDPWDWTVSGWKHVTGRKNAYGDAPPDFRTFVLGDWRSGATHNPHPKKYESAHAHVAYHAKTTQDGHMALDGRPAAMAFIGRFERLEEDWGRICERLGRDIALPHENRSDRRAYEDYYDDETREAVARANAGLIERFGYAFGE